MKKNAQLFIQVLRINITKMYSHTAGMFLELQYWF